MEINKQVLLLVGSPKKELSTSESLGSYFLNKIKQRGFNTKKMFIYDIFNSEDTLFKLLRAVKRSYLVVLSYPLYIDTLPAPLIKSLQFIKKNSGDFNKEKKLIVLVNCGFPERSHIKNSLKVCRQFALQSGIKWECGLDFSMGMLINGRDLNDLGKRSQNIRIALDLVVKAICEEKDIYQEIYELLENDLVPRWLYTFIGSINWRIQALKNHSYLSLKNKPFQ